MTHTLYTVTATRCHGFIRFIRHDLDSDAAYALCAKLNADGYDDVTRTRRTATRTRPDAPQTASVTSNLYARRKKRRRTWRRRKVEVSHGS